MDVLFTYLAPGFYNYNKNLNKLESNQLVGATVKGKQMFFLSFGYCK